jgi:hypothetical protein
MKLEHKYGDSYNENFVYAIYRISFSYTYLIETLRTDLISQLHVHYIREKVSRELVICRLLSNAV